MIDSTKRWLGCGANRNIIRCGLECETVQTFENYLAFFQIGLNFYLPYGPEIPFLPKNTCTRMFIAALVIIAPNWKQAKCSSTGEWINNI